MRVFFNSRHDAHDGAGEMHHGRMVPCFENARRIPIIRDAVAHAIKAQLFDPKDHGMDPIRAIHDPDYLDFLETAWDGWTKAGNSGDAFPMSGPLPVFPVASPNISAPVWANMPFHRTRRSRREPGRPPIGAPRQ